LEDLQGFALRLIDQLESMLLEVGCLRTVLECDSDVSDWREQVETLKILKAHRVRDKFHEIRALVRANPNANLLPDDLDSVVRRILDTVQELDDPAHPLNVSLQASLWEEPMDTPNIAGKVVVLRMVKRRDLIPVKVHSLTSKGLWTRDQKLLGYCYPDPMPIPLGKSPWIFLPLSQIEWLILPDTDLQPETQPEKSD